MLFPVFMYGAVAFQDEGDEESSKICIYICQNCSRPRCTPPPPPLPLPPPPRSSHPAINEHCNLPDVICQSFGKYLRHVKPGDAVRQPEAPLDGSKRNLTVWREIGKDLAKIACHFEKEQEEQRQSTGWHRGDVSNFIMHNLIILAFWQTCRWLTR